ncbi:MAG: Maf family protein [Bdellovibrionota bacterium]
MGSILNVPIILASSSPRRIELLKQIGLTVIRMIPTADESQKKGEMPLQMVKRLAKEKAESVIPLVLREYSAAVILSADTVVVEPGGKRIFGKPKDVADARKMLSKIAGKTHIVYTGYCIYETGRDIEPRFFTRAVTSKVKMRRLSKITIDRYIKSGEPMDKAGAYAAQGLGTALIERISGSYTNVVGLPISDIVQDLEIEFKIPLFSWNESHVESQKSP